MSSDDTSQATPLSPEGIDTLDFGDTGLVPVVVQDRRTGTVLMVAFTNREMVAKTLETGNAWFWSRSRRAPWQKGETSGNFIRVREVRRNCEDNSLLYLADPVGPVCHTGAPHCYYRRLDGTRIAGDDEWGGGVAGAAGSHTGDAAPAKLEPGSVDWLFQIVKARQAQMPEGSYVAGLLARGVDRIAKKVGEEAAEVIIAAKNRSAEELANEMADLWFHSLILLADAGLEPRDVARVLAARHRPDG